MRHLHSDTLVSLLCLEDRLARYHCEREFALEAVKASVESYFDEVAEQLLKAIESSKEATLEQVRVNAKKQAHHVLGKLQAGTTLRQLSKKELLQLNEAVHDLQFRDLKSLLGEIDRQKGMTQGPVSRFVEELGLQCLRGEGFKFSKSFKGENMVISEKGRRITQTAYNGEYDRLSLIEPALPLQGVSRIKLKVRLSSWVGMGLMVFDELEDICMKFEYSDRVRGVYMISSNGYSWWHNEMYLSNGVSFGDGEVVELEFDPSALTLAIFVGGKAIRTAVDPALVLENNLYFGVNLSSEEDSCLIL